MKDAKTITTKALGDGRGVLPEQLAQINKYAMVPLTPEQVYVRKYLVANNALDRDNERFSEEVLNDFAVSLPGKGFFVEGHPGGYSGSGGPGKGLFFNAFTEDMSVEQFSALTGETPELPAGIASVRALWGEAYILRLDSNKDTLANIDGGIYRFVSIGFKAPLFDVTGEHGNYIYGEYRPKGEAREASLVWLGAQVGAVAIKGVKNNKEEEATKTMKLHEQLTKTLNRPFSEENLIEEIKAVVDGKDVEITGLKAAAADGAAYRKALVEDTVRFGVLVDEIPTDAEGQKAEAGFLNTLPIERLKGMKDKFEKRARETHPDKFIFEGKTEADRKAAAETGAGEESPLVADAQKRAEAINKGGI